MPCGQQKDLTVLPVASSSWRRDSVNSHHDSSSVTLDRMGCVTVCDPMSINPESAISRSSLPEQGAYFGGGCCGIEISALAAIASIRALRTSGRIQLSDLKTGSSLPGTSSSGRRDCSLNQRTLSVHIQSSPRTKELTTKKVAGKPNSLSSGNRNS